MPIVKRTRSKPRTRPRSYKRTGCVRSRKRSSSRGRFAAAALADPIPRWPAVAYRFRPEDILVKCDEEITSLALSPDGRTLASAEFDNSLQQFGSAGHGFAIPPIRLWSSETRRQVKEFAYRPDAAGADLAKARRMQNGRYFRSTNSPMFPGAYDQQIGNFYQHMMASVNGLSFSPDGRILAAGYADGTVRMWPVQPYGEESVRWWADQTRPIRELTVDDHVRAMVFSPDGQALVVRADSIVLLSGETSRKLFGQNYVSSNIATSGRLITYGTSSQPYPVYVQDIATGRLIQRLVGHTSIVYSVAFSPDGHAIASGSNDKTVRIWDVETGRQINELGGIEHSINHVAFSPDGRIVIFTTTGSGPLGQLYGSIRLWLLETNRQVVLREHHEQITAFTVGSDSIAYATRGHGPPTTIYWNLSYRRTIAELEKYISADVVKNIIAPYMEEEKQ